MLYNRSSWAKVPASSGGWNRLPRPQALASIRGVMSSNHKLAIVAAKAGTALALLLLLLLGVTHLGFDFDFKLPWAVASPPGPFIGEVPKLESRCGFKNLPQNFEY